LKDSVLSKCNDAGGAKAGTPVPNPKWGSSVGFWAFLYSDIKATFITRLPQFANVDYIIWTGMYIFQMVLVVTGTVFI